MMKYDEHMAQRAWNCHDHDLVESVAVGEDGAPTARDLRGVCRQALTAWSMGFTLKTKPTLDLTAHVVVDRDVMSYVSGPAIQ